MAPDDYMSLSGNAAALAFLPPMDYFSPISVYLALPISLAP